MSSADRAALLADRLDELAEEIADLAIDEIRSALRGRDEGRPSGDKRLTQARRAVAKAAHLLRHLDADSTDDMVGD